MQIQTKNPTRKLVAVSIGHFMNDFYVSILPAILFLLSASLSLTLTEQAIIVAALSFGGSLSQPIIGYLVDRYGNPWLLVLSLIWITILMSLVGFAGNFIILAVFAGLGALASALYHPLGSSLAAALGRGSRGRSLSIFMMIGGFAAASAPLIAIPLVEKMGFKALSLLIIPGLLTALFMIKTKVHQISIQRDHRQTKKNLGKIEFCTVKWLFSLIFIAITRTMLGKIMVSFGIPLFLLRNVTIGNTGMLLFFYLIMNAVGTLVGGYSSDRFGQKIVFIVANSLLVLSMGMMVSSQGSSMFFWYSMVALGLSLANTPNIVIAQEIIPRNTTFATGLIMGFAGGLGGIGIMLFGSLADRLSLPTAIGMMMIPIVISGLLTLLLPKEGSICRNPAALELAN